jgi:hypothetical protein
MGVFYLGRHYEKGETLPSPLLYDSRDLVTHAMCVGMTGSGKTGLCISLLEEAAIDQVPALVIDFKGDLGNLLLNFPDLRGEDFRPWIDEDAAVREGIDGDEHARRQAELWKRGLADWDQDGDRLRRLKEAAEISIYTPGSEAGLPVSILSSFAAPPPAVLDDNDLLRERVSNTVTSLLAMLGVDADPLRSREHILLSTLLDHAWREGQDLDLAGLITALQDPPFERIGVMSLESFYPAKERFELAMTLNNLLAAPSFKSWMTGTPLDIDQLLYTAEGKPRVAIFTLSHLSDTERMFFVSLLLNQTLGWMRGCSGTNSLRALLYIDEIFGYLPPVANPPSKLPLLTLLKQARAFGLGLLLATQNPVDLDYKALSNIGTWFLGRLQTQRDKERVLDGLISTAEGALDRQEIEQLLSSLDKRVFLLHNVHEEAPVLFKVRWAMSYLRGPLTRKQIQRLTAERQASTAPPVTAVPARAASQRREPAPAAPTSGSNRPLLPPEIPQRFLPVTEAAGELVYRPHLLGTARVHFVNTRKGLEAQREVMLLAVLDEDGKADWHEAEEIQLDPEELTAEPAAEPASFTGLPAAASRAKSITAWKKAFADVLYRKQRYELFKSPTIGLISKPGESEREFRIRLTGEAHEQRDELIEKMRDKYAPKQRTLEGRILKAEQKLEREREQAKEQKFNAVISLGTSLLSAFLGRKKLSSTNVRRAQSAVRGFSRSSKEAKDAERAEESLELLLERREELDDELKTELEEVRQRCDPQREELEPLILKPRRSDVELRQVALAWVPYRR